VPPPFTGARLLPPAEGFSTAPPRLLPRSWSGIFDPHELVPALKDLLTRTVLDDLQRRVPGLRAIRSVYGAAEQHGQLGADLVAANDATIAGVFRAASEVIRCMAGSPCDQAFVSSLPESRGEPLRSTAYQWIRRHLGSLEGGGEEDEGTE
jgi:hypothetical protein